MFKPSMHFQYRVCASFGPKLAMVTDPEGCPLGFPDPALWRALCVHAPQAATFAQQQFGEMVEGTSTEVAIYRRVVLFVVLPDLLTASRRAGLALTVKDDLGLSGIDELTDLYDVCSLLHHKKGLLSTIPTLVPDGNAVVHVGQLKLPPKQSFLAPALALVLQAVRHIFAKYTFAPLSGFFTEDSPGHSTVPQDSPGHGRVPEDSPGFDGPLNRSFILNGENVARGFAVQALALATASSNFQNFPADLKSFLSQVPVVPVDCPTEAGAALVENHFQSVINQSMHKRVSEWSHYDYLVQHCDLSHGDTIKAIQELNIKLKDDRLKLNLRKMQRLENLIDPQKTPAAFRSYINSFRQYLDDDAEDLHLTRTMLNNTLFFMGSAPTRTTGLVKEMYTQGDQSFMLTCQALGADWLQACNAHVPRDGNKWPKQPSLETFVLHRHNVSFFINLLNKCWSKAAGDSFAADALSKFQQDYKPFYNLLKCMRDDFQAEAHTVRLEEDARYDFLLQLSRKHFPLFDNYLSQNEVSAKSVLEQSEREDAKRNVAKCTSECFQFLQSELTEAEATLKQYDVLVSKLKVSRNIAAQSHEQEYQKQKAIRMEAIRIHKLPQLSAEEASKEERFACLEFNMKEQMEKLRTYIASVTGLPETDVYILINLNLGLRRLVDGSLQARKLGTGLLTCMKSQDAVLYRPVEWFSKTEQVELLQREIADAVFEAPQRKKAPIYTKTELSLAKKASKSIGGQFLGNRITAIFARHAAPTAKVPKTEYVHADSWIDNHEESQLWGTDEIWASTSLMNLPLNETGVWNDADQDYVSLTNASRTIRVGSSGVEFDAEIFARLCQGPLDANKAVGIYDPGMMMGSSFKIK